MDALDHESLAMPNKTNPTNRVILVADDDPLLVMLLEHHLSAAGYRVVSAPDGEAALALVVRKQSGANVVALAEDVRAEIAEMAPELEKRGIRVAFSEQGQLDD